MNVFETRFSQEGEIPPMHYFSQVETDGKNIGPIGFGICNVDIS
tara:strand:- start:259 stop:390 length:132 start_codon:yes stop_codon:yes gene_type:complete